MAKIYGLNGALRGRQGNNVFSIQNGTQVVKAYQPVVANPRTPAQVSQRTKFALVGRMSSATPLLAISGLMGSSPRAKRARFVSLLTKMSTVTQTGLDFRASVALRDVVYAEGSLPIYSAAASFTATWQSGSSNIAVNITPGVASASAPVGYGELFVVALYDTESNNLELTQVVERAASSSAVISLTLRASYVHTCYVALYKVPFNRLTNLSSPDNSFVGADENDVYLVGSQRGLMSGADWGHSAFVSTVQVLGTTASHSVVPGNDDERRKK